IINNFRLPILDTAQPDKGKDNIKPTGRANNTPPSSTSERESFCCMVAILDAQLEKQSPAIKNIAATAVRITIFEYCEVLGCSLCVCINGIRNLIYKNRFIIIHQQHMLFYKLKKGSTVK